MYTLIRIKPNLLDLRFSYWWLRTIRSSAFWYHTVQWKSEVSEGYIVSIFGVEKQPEQEANNKKMVPRNLDLMYVYARREL